MCWSSRGGRGVPWGGDRKDRENIPIINHWPLAKKNIVSWALFFVCTSFWLIADLITASVVQHSTLDSIALHWCLLDLAHRYTMEFIIFCECYTQMFTDVHCTPAYYYNRLWCTLWVLCIEVRWCSPDCSGLVQWTMVMSVQQGHRLSPNFSGVHRTSVYTYPTSRTSMVDANEVRCTSSTLSAGVYYWPKGPWWGIKIDVYIECNIHHDDLSEVSAQYLHVSAQYYIMYLMYLHDYGIHLHDIGFWLHTNHLNKTHRSLVRKTAICQEGYQMPDWAWYGSYLAR